MFLYMFIPNIAWNTLILNQYLLFIWNSKWTSYPILFQATLSPERVRTVKKFSPTKLLLKLWLNGFKRHFNSGPAFSLECELNVIEKQLGEWTFSEHSAPSLPSAACGKLFPFNQLGRKKASLLRWLSPPLLQIGLFLGFAGELLLLIACRLQSKQACQLWRWRGGAER